MEHVNSPLASSPSSPSSIRSAAGDILASPELTPNQEPVSVNETAFRVLARRTGNMHMVYGHLAVADDAFDSLIEAGAEVVTGSRYSPGQLGSIVADWKGRPIYLKVYNRDRGELMASAKTHAEALRAYGDISELLKCNDQLAPSEVDLRFWYGGSEGKAHFTSKTVAVKTIGEVTDSLSDSAAQALNELAQYGWMRGGIHVWHGPPGCGKTTALQALAHAWRDYMLPEIVLDPEVMLAGTQYLMRILDSPEHRRLKEMGVTRPRRFIVLEDAGEFVGIDARTYAGSGISRLLNMTDGMFGRGDAPVVIITTNEPIKKLHPAIMRPGRCRSVVEFGPVPKARAQEWLIKRGHTASVASSEMSIAELAAIAGSSAPVSAKVARKIGFGE